MRVHCAYSYSHWLESVMTYFLVRKLIFSYWCITTSSDWCYYSIKNKNIMTDFLAVNFWCDYLAWYYNKFGIFRLLRLMSNISIMSDLCQFKLSDSFNLYHQPCSHQQKRIHKIKVKCMLEYQINISVLTFAFHTLALSVIISTSVRLAPLSEWEVTIIYSVLH